MPTCLRDLFAAAGAVASLSLVAGLAAGCAHHDASNATLPEASSAAPRSSAAADSTGTPGNPAIKREIIDATLNPNKLPAYEGPTGSVEGTITVVGPASPDVKIENSSHCPAAIDTFGKLFREGTPAEPEGPRPLADAVVAVVGYGGYYVPEKRGTESVTIAADCSFPARTLAVTFGQKLEVTNLSKYPFAPVLDPGASPAVMMAPPLGAGDPVRIYPRRPGHMIMGDLMQEYVREDVYVLRFPLHAVSDRSGHYRIDGIPVGKLTVGAEHPTVASRAEAPVEIKENVVAKVDLLLKYDPKTPEPRDKASNILR